MNTKIVNVIFTLLLLLGGRSVYADFFDNWTDDNLCGWVDRTLIWWRWGELNPRPKTFSQEVYMFSKGLLS
jgi:hypothetical protein